jgi:hypothetical protein
MQQRDEEGQRWSAAAGLSKRLHLLLLLLPRRAPVCTRLCATLGLGRSAAEGLRRGRRSDSTLPTLGPRRGSEESGFPVFMRRRVHADGLEGNSGRWFDIRKTVLGVG